MDDTTETVFKRGLLIDIVVEAHAGPEENLGGYGH